MAPLAYTLAALSTELSEEGNFFQDKQLNYLVNNFLFQKKKKKKKISECEYKNQKSTNYNYSIMHQKRRVICIKKDDGQVST